MSFIKSIILVMVSFVFWIGTANALDSVAREQLIKKFENLRHKLPDDNPAKVTMTLRLADLLSEKGRLAANEELGTGCYENCLAGKKERVQALELYEEVISKSDPAKHSKVNLQMGHIAEMLEDTNGAFSYYKKAVSTAKNKTDKIEAYFSLGEVQYKNSRFESAVKSYDVVASSDLNYSKKGQAAYRAAWSMLNLGQPNVAMQRLVKLSENPSLMGSAGSGYTQDVSFQEEISRDLVVFVAKKGFEKKDYGIVERISPDHVRDENLASMALELERLGDKTGSIEVWSKLNDSMKDPIDRWEGRTHLARLLFDLENKPESLVHYKKSLALEKSLGSCVEKRCTDLRAQTRNFIVDWTKHKSEKVTPSPQLLEAYTYYWKANKDNIEVTYSLASLLNKADKKEEAIKYFQTISEMPVRKLTEDQVKLVDLALEENILWAESLKNIPKRKLAYLTYLKKSPTKTRADQINYQLASLEYESNNYEAAADKFYSYAKGTKSNTEEIQKLKLQAADLALDSLVLAKNQDVKITKWSAEFADLFPSKSNEFSSVSRKSALNKSAELAQGTMEQKKEALKLLGQTDWKSSESPEKLMALKNQIILSEEVGEIAQSRMKLKEYMLDSTLSEDDKNWAHLKYAYYSELLFDFEGAITSLSMLTEKAMPTDKKLLRQAVLRDLSSKTENQYALQFIKDYPERDESLSLANQFYDENATWASFESFKDVFIKNKAVYSEKLASLFGKSSDYGKVVEHLAPVKDDVSTLWPSALNRIVFWKNNASTFERIQKHVVNADTDKQLGETLTQRLAYMEELQALVNKGIESKDGVLQAALFELTSKEYQRFYDEVMSLPLPEGLTQDEQMQYMQLLSEKTTPYQVQAEELNKKIDEFWVNSDSLKKDWRKSLKLDDGLYAVYQSSFAILKEAVPKSHKSSWKKFQDEAAQERLALKQDVTSKSDHKLALDTKKRKQWSELRSMVIKEPLNEKALEKLISFESGLDSKSKMLSFLNQRLKQIAELNNKQEGES